MPSTEVLSDIAVGCGLVAFCFELEPLDLDFFDDEDGPHFILTSPSAERLDVDFDDMVGERVSLVRARSARFLVVIEDNCGRETAGSPTVLNQTENSTRRFQALYPRLRRCNPPEAIFARICSALVVKLIQLRSSTSAGTALP